MAGTYQYETGWTKCVGVCMPWIWSPPRCRFMYSSRLRRMKKIKKNTWTKDEPAHWSYMGGDDWRNLCWKCFPKSRGCREEFLVNGWKTANQYNFTSETYCLSIICILYWDRGNVPASLLMESALHKNADRTCVILLKSSLPGHAPRMSLYAPFRSYVKKKITALWALSIVPRYVQVYSILIITVLQKTIWKIYSPEIDWMLYGDVREKFS